MRRFLQRSAAVLGLALAAASADGRAADSRALDALPMHALPAAAVERAIAAILRDGPAHRFAATLDLPLSLDDGAWDRSPDGLARWRLRLFSAGARTLSVDFAGFDLPPSASLRLSDAAGSVIQGPYTAEERGEGDELWSAVVPGETAVIELTVAPAEREAVHLRILRVHHGFRGFAAAGGVLPKSGACNIDVVCPQGEDWRDEIRSVAMLVGGGFACSGTLVNNTRQDGDPLILTANHCGFGGATAPASQLTVYWKYQTSSCGGTPNGSLNQNQHGATRLASDARSDFTLLRLSSPPSAAFRVHYAGWYVGSGTPQRGVSIHHPGADEKRISVFSTPAVRADVCLGELVLGACSGTTVRSWAVNWSEGITELGSSGGGLWNQDHRLVGVLSGGTRLDCDDAPAPDYYGRLEEAWPAGLKAYLDPGDTGATALDGRNPGTVAASSGTSGGDGGGAPTPAALLVALVAALLRLATSRRACRGGSAG